ncbi:hypothetical protein HMPREF3189_01232 [Clostridiales bacterium KA00134]|nr:hypothetical protein HMPREF3189_01232 [Clostridiales bacterium KA00134]
MTFKVESILNFKAINPNKMTTIKPNKNFFFKISPKISYHIGLIKSPNNIQLSYEEKK